MVLPLPENAVVLGLLAAATWGAADFAGGLATRRAPPSRVVLFAHGTSLVLLAAASLRVPAHLLPWATGEAILSGVAGGVALMLFYEALALGAMGLSAALAGLLTAVLPVVLAARTEGLPGPKQLAGFALALLAIVLIAYAPSGAGASPRRARRALVLSGLAGVGFGLQLIWLHASASGGVAAPGAEGAALAPVVRALMLSRLGGTAVALAAWGLALARGRTRLLPEPAQSGVHLPFSRFPLPALAVLAGLLDTGGNGLYMFSSLGGRLDVAAVLSSLYPGATIVLAMVFLRERATWLQALGMGLALAAVALIAI